MWTNTRGCLARRDGVYDRYTPSRAHPADRRASRTRGPLPRVVRGPWRRSVRLSAISPALGRRGRGRDGRRLSARGGRGRGVRPGAGLGTRVAAPDRQKRALRLPPAGTSPPPRLAHGALRPAVRRALARGALAPRGGDN